MRISMLMCLLKCVGVRTKGYIRTGSLPGKHTLEQSVPTCFIVAFGSEKSIDLRHWMGRKSGRGAWIEVMRLRLRLRICLGFGCALDLDLTVPWLSRK